MNNFLKYFLSFVLLAVLASNLSAAQKFPAKIKKKHGLVVIEIISIGEKQEWDFVHIAKYKESGEYIRTYKALADKPKGYNTYLFMAHLKPGRYAITGVSNKLGGSSMGATTPFNVYDQKVTNLGSLIYAPVFPKESPENLSAVKSRPMTYFRAGNYSDTENYLLNNEKYAWIPKDMEFINNWESPIPNEEIMKYRKVSYYIARTTIQHSDSFGNIYLGGELGVIHEMRPNGSLSLIQLPEKNPVTYISGKDPELLYISTAENLYKFAKGSFTKIDIPVEKDMKIDLIQSDKSGGLYVLKSDNFKSKVSFKKATSHEWQEIITKKFKGGINCISTNFYYASNLNYLVFSYSHSGMIVINLDNKEIEDKKINGSSIDCNVYIKKELNGGISVIKTPHFSLDYGKTWNKMTKEKFGLIRDMMDETLVPTDSKTLYRITALAQNQKVIGTEKIQKSIDLGQNWEDVGEITFYGKTRLFYEPITKSFLLLIDPYLDRGIYSEALISTDSMKNWTHVKPALLYQIE